jgi:hypothetical protein
LAGEPKPESKPDNDRKGIEWIDTGMVTHFANVVNVQGTREQIDLFFGTNRTWNVTPTSGVTVELSNRLILTPLAAKRLANVLTNVLREHEARYGALNLE